MLAGLADFVHRRRWFVIAAWLVLLLLGGGIGTRVFANLDSSTNVADDTGSATALRRLTELRPQGQQVAGLIEADPSAPAVASEITATAAELRRIPGVATVLDWPATRAPALRSTDGRATLISVSLTPGLDEAAAGEAQEAVVERLRAVRAGPVTVGGGALAQEEFGHQAERDLLRGELIALPVMAVLLLVLIGGFLAASLPLAVALVSIAGGLLLLYGVSSLTDINEFAVNVVTMLGLGLAVDYSLLIVNRFREERARGLDVHDAVVATSATAGRTVLFSGLTVATAMCGLLVFAEAFLRSFAYGGAGVVLIAALSAVTLVPALLSVAGHRIRPARPAREGRGLFYRVSRFTQRFALVIVPVVAIALAVLAVPFGRAELQNSSIDTLPGSSEPRRFAEAVAARFPGGGTDPVQVVAETAPDAPALAAYVARLEALPDAAAVTVEPIGGSAALVSVVPRGTSQGPEARRLVEAVRGIEPGFPAGVTGEAAFLVDYRDSIAERLPIAAALIVIATMVLLFLMTGSLVVPLKAIVMGALSLGATFGALVWVFQDGHLSGLLGFDPTGYVDITVPVLVFVFGFGLSMDYEMFLLSRIKETWDETGDNDRAVAVGLQQTGRIVTAAAVLITVVLLGFASGDLLTIKQVGIALALAVVLDATVVRMLLVPSTMKLLGRWNWWAPGPLARFQRRFGLRETPGTLARKPAGTLVDQ